MALRRSSATLMVCPLLLHPQLPRKVVEHAQLIAVEISHRELPQVPRLILRLGHDLRSRLSPSLMQLVDFLLAFQIQPDHDRAIALLPELGIGQEHSAIPLRDAPDPVLNILPVEMEPKHVYVVIACLVNITDRNLRNGVGKARKHGFQLTTRAALAPLGRRRKEPRALLIAERACTCSLVEITMDARPPENLATVSFSTSLRRVFSQLRPEVRNGGGGGKADTL